jgi:methylglutaconyl-CoA hydratase
MPNSTVLVSTAGPITTLTLNRPDRRNALTVELLEALCEAVSGTEATPGQRILVLRGAGPAFCAGLDLNEVADSSRAEASANLIARSLRLLSGSRLATIAVVHGAAVAGGAGLMSACDFVLAANDTKIGYPEVRRGLVAGLVMTFLRRQVGERDAREILLLGELFSAERARAMGLVNRVVGSETLDAELKGIAEALLAGGPESIAHTKQLWSELWPYSVDTDLNRALTYHMKARNSAEAKEGIAAFKEKRPPRW